MVDPFNADNQVVRRQPSTISTESKEDNLIDYSADEGRDDEENEPEVPFSNLQRWNHRCTRDNFILFVVFLPYLLYY